jgi:hypothetical protein
MNKPIIKDPKDLYGGTTKALPSVNLRVVSANASASSHLRECLTSLFSYCRQSRHYCLLVQLLARRHAYRTVEAHMLAVEVAVGDQGAWGTAPARRDLPSRLPEPAPAAAYRRCRAGWLDDTFRDLKSSGMISKSNPSANQFQLLTRSSRSKRRCAALTALSWLLAKPTRMVLCGHLN